MSQNIALCVITILVIYLTGAELSGVCPKTDSIKPCVCIEQVYGRDIRCEGNQTLDLMKVFEALDSHLNETDRQFGVFHLSNTAITELKANTFKDITFDEIFIGYSKSLTKIDENAFNGTDLVTKYLSFYNNSALSLPDNTLYKIVGKFTKLQYFELENSNEAEIPANALGTLEHLLEVHFAGDTLKKLASKSFAKLPNLLEITFEQVNLTIPDYAFEFEKNNQTLVIDFSKSPKVTSSVFTPKSLLNMRRPATIRFGSSTFPKQMTYLEEKAFLPFLLENDKNGIDLKGEAFDCNDCRNYWLKKNQKALNRVSALTCSDKKPFNDAAHFKNCTG